MKTFELKTGRDEDRTVDEVIALGLRTVLNHTLADSKVLKSLTGPNGQHFTLLALDDESIQSAENRIRNSSKSDHALWQKFLADKHYEKLAAELAKLVE